MKIIYKIFSLLYPERIYIGSAINFYRRRKPLSPEHRANISKGLKEKRYGNKILLETN